MTGSLRYAYRTCRCGKTHRIPEGTDSLTCECGLEVERPRKKRRAPDVVLPRP